MFFSLLKNFEINIRIFIWDLHLDSLREIIPWYFVHDRVNHSRYLCAYWLEMKMLQILHPGKDCITFINFYIIIDEHVQQFVNKTKCPL